MKKRLALLGHGYLNQIVANSIKDGILPEYELVGILGRNPEKVEAVANKYGCKACLTIDELMELKPDYVAEAASADVIRNYGEKILKSGSGLIILSAAALADNEFYEKLKQTAIENDSKIYLPGGATGAYKLLKTASFMSNKPIEVKITSKKSPQFLSKTPFYREGLENIQESERVFTGTARSIMEEYPYVFNVILATSLASAGPEDTKFNIDATPNFSGDDYRIEVKGDDVQLDLSILSQDYALAAWSVVSVLKNIVSPVVF